MVLQCVSPLPPRGVRISPLTYTFNLNKRTDILSVEERPYMVRPEHHVTARGGLTCLELGVPEISPYSAIYVFCYIGSVKRLRRASVSVLRSLRGILKS